MKKTILIILALITTACYSQVGDCPAQYICAGSPLTAVVDVTDELNPTNQGCLGVNEGTTSYWVQICAQTTGTIQFQIAPNGANNDYDWAVWNGSTCPPTTAPIRCSFAISNPGPGGDNTGVNSTNNAPQTDNSEGAGGNQWVQDINAIAGDCYTICINNYGTGSNNFTLSFSGTSTLNCSPLPIELTEFTCNSTDKFIELNWTTQSETNNDYFNVERSQNGINWQKISTIMGQGTSTTPFSYVLRDSYPPYGNNYYRLKQVDYNADFTYTEIINCNFENNNSEEVTYYNILGQVVNIHDSPSGLYLKQINNNGIINTYKIIK